jgi:hypothetical protein
MITANNLHEEIQQQVNIGFNRQEIEQNLLPKGYAETDIRQALDKVQFAEVAVTGSNGSSGSVSTKSILLGLLFIVAACVRLARFAKGGNIIFGLGVITAVGMAIYFFSKRK